MFSNRKKPVEARKVGSTLVAVFRHSNPSLVWKFDLARNHSFTVALQGEEGDWELGVTSPKGEFYSIARFASREDAEAAFTAVQKILMKSKRNWFVGPLQWIIVIGVIGLIGLYIADYALNHVLSGMQKEMTLMAHDVTSMPPGAPPPVPNGIPVPADLALRPPQ
jgi:hypothetical protein